MIGLDEDVPRDELEYAARVLRSKVEKVSITFDDDCLLIKGDKPWEERIDVATLRALRVALDHTFFHYGVCGYLDEDSNELELENALRQQEYVEGQERKKNGGLTDMEVAKQLLDPSGVWNLSSITKRMKILKSLNDSSIDKIADVIRKMEYKDFLRTPYWKTIADYVKRKANYKCAVCGDNKRLNVHHRNYNNHGYEFEVRDTDLVCLCADCHNKFHDKFEIEEA